MATQTVGQASGRSLDIPRDARGHFAADGRIDGQRINFMPMQRMRGGIFGALVCKFMPASVMSVQTPSQISSIEQDQSGRKASVPCYVTPLPSP